MTQSRRDLLLAIGAGVSGAMLVRRAGAAPTRHVGAPKSALAVAPGTTLGSCTVVAVDPARDGAIPVRMTDSRGQSFTVEVMRFDPAAPGIARAGSLAVYLRNGGDGAKSTHEEHGLAAMALARVLEEKEASGAPVPMLTSVRKRRSPAR